jgi:RND family efflux transporter MFP subunit
VVKEGDDVTAGATLVILEGQMLSEGVRQAQAAIDAATASSDALRDDVERIRALVKAGSASRQQLDGVEARLRSADAQVRQLEAALSQASTQRNRTTLRAPIAGTVAQITLQEGDLATPGIPLLTVVRRDRLRAVLRVPERQFLKIASGMPVHLAPLARPDLDVAAEVSVLGPVIDRATRTGLVEVHIDNADGLLVPGSAVRVRIEVDRRKDAVLVPSRAIILGVDTERTGEATAFVVKEGIAKRRTITLGERQGDNLEVRDGLEAGEELVVVGAHLLRDDSPVKVLGKVGITP